MTMVDSSESNKFDVNTRFWNGPRSTLVYDLTMHGKQDGTGYQVIGNRYARCGDAIGGDSVQFSVRMLSDERW